MVEDEEELYKNKRAADAYMMVNHAPGKEAARFSRAQMYENKVKKEV